MRTPQQTIGPFFHEALRWEDGGRIAFAEKGTPIVLSGRVTDGEGKPVADAMIEAWQLSPTGKPPAAGTTRPHGFGRVETDADGRYRFKTLMPGAAEGNAPAIDIAIHARGLLRPLRTRVFLADESKVRADPVAKALGDSPRLKTLVASPSGNEYRWDVRLQGDGETVFFDL